MNRYDTIFLLAILFPCAASAAGNGLSDNLKRGKALHEKACVACHVEKFGGDGSRIYTRPDRLIGDKAALAQRVAACNANFKLGLPPQDLALVAAYLNEQHYRFK